VELTRFREDLIVGAERSVHDAEESSARTRRRAGARCFGGVVVGTREGEQVAVVEYAFSRRAVAELLSRARSLVRRQTPVPRATDATVLWL